MGDLGNGNEQELQRGQIASELFKDDVFLLSGTGSREKTLAS